MLSQNIPWDINFFMGRTWEPMLHVTESLFVELDRNPTTFYIHWVIISVYVKQMDTKLFHNPKSPPHANFYIAQVDLYPQAVLLFISTVLPYHEYCINSTRFFKKALKWVPPINSDVFSHSDYCSISTLHLSIAQLYYNV